MGRRLAPYAAFQMRGRYAAEDVLPGDAVASRHDGLFTKRFSRRVTSALLNVVSVTTTMMGVETFST